MTAKPDEKPCGKCRIVGSMSGARWRQRIELCPLHAAAGQMAEALKNLRDEAHGALELERLSITGLIGVSNVKCLDLALAKAEAALAAAGRGK